MEALFWIIGIILAVVLVAAVVIVLGLRRKKTKEISFEERDELEQKKPSSGDYKAQGGFNFTAGGGVSNADAMEAMNRPKPKDPTAVSAPSPASEPSAQPTMSTESPKREAPTAQQTPDDRPIPETQVDRDAIDKSASGDEAAESTDDSEDSAPSQTTSDEGNRAAHTSSVAAAQPTAPTAVPSEPASEIPAGLVQPQYATSADADTVGSTPSQLSESSSAEEPQARLDNAEDAEDTKDAADSTDAKDVANVTDGAIVDHKDDIAPVDGRLGELRSRLAKSQNVIGRGVLGILSAGDLDEDAWEEIEDTLIMADLGTKTTVAVVEDLRERIATQGVSNEAEARAMLRSTLIEHCKPEMDRSIRAMPYEGNPAVVMVVGVNGTGKTTTTGKLSRVLVGMGHKVLLGAADTFRAAAADQLETWGRRVGADTVRGREGADPASVAFDAVAQGIDQGVDVVLVDTAGRLHTSVGLMDQLGKVKRVVEKKAKVDEVLLVLDATVGQNGLTQARIFREVVDITGVVLTKLDGTAKGGIVFQVQEELGVPVKLVGLGEGADDLAPFEVESFVDALLG